MLAVLHSFDWVYKVIHRGTFLDEVQQLWQCVQRGQGDQIDPAWLALFYMVSCEAASEMVMTDCTDTRRLEHR